MTEQRSVNKLLIKNNNKIILCSNAHIVHERLEVRKGSNDTICLPVIIRRLEGLFQCSFKLFFPLLSNRIQLLETARTGCCNFIGKVFKSSTLPLLYFLGMKDNDYLNVIQLASYLKWD